MKTAGSVFLGLRDPRFFSEREEVQSRSGYQARIETMRIKGADPGDDEPEDEGRLVFDLLCPEKRDCCVMVLRRCERGPGRLRRFVRELLGPSPERLVLVWWRSVADDHGEEYFVVGVLGPSGRGARSPSSRSSLSVDETFVTGDSGSGTQLLSVLLCGSNGRCSADPGLSY